MNGVSVYLRIVDFTGGTSVLPRTGLPFAVPLPQFLQRGQVISMGQSGEFPDAEYQPPRRFTAARPAAFRHAFFSFPNPSGPDVVLEGDGKDLLMIDGVPVDQARTLLPTITDQLLGGMGGRRPRINVGEMIALITSLRDMELTMSPARRDDPTLQLTAISAKLSIASGTATFGLVYRPQDVHRALFIPEAVGVWQETDSDDDRLTEFREGAVLLLGDSTSIFGRAAFSPAEFARRYMTPDGQAITDVGRQIAHYIPSKEEQERHSTVRRAGLGMW